jgi:hypothetical protein
MALYPRAFLVVGLATALGPLVVPLAACIRISTGGPGDIIDIELFDIGAPQLYFTPAAKPADSASGSAPSSSGAGPGAPAAPSMKGRTVPPGSGK